MLTKRGSIAVLGLAGLWAVASVSADETLPADVQPFALPAATLLRVAAAPRPRDEFPVVFLHEATRFAFDERQRLTLTTHQIYRIDANSATAQFGQVQAIWEPARQRRPTIRARVVTPDGREHRFDPATLSDESASDRDPLLFDDTRMLRGPLPAIVPGSVVEVEQTAVDLEPPFESGRSHQVYVGAAGAVEQTLIVVSAPTSIPLRYAKRVLPDAVVAEEIRNGRRQITLQQGPVANEFDKMFMEASGDKPIWPQFLFSTGESWSAVASAYEELAAPFIRPDEVRSLLPKELPAGRDELIASLFAILHERVRYTGVLFGQGKIVPNSPSVTLERRFGDCKDKAVVFASLLRAAGLPAQIVLINSSTSVDIDPALPGIGDFNHMIVHVPGERPLWIDPTTEYMKVGELPQEDVDRWALVIGESGAPLVRTPVRRPSDNHGHEVREVRLTDYGAGDLQIEGRHNGPTAAGFRALWSDINSAERKRQLEQFRTAYSAKSIERFEMGEDPATGSITYVLELKRIAGVSTDLREANVGMSIAEMFSELPFGLRSDEENFGEDESESGADQAEPKLPRTADWVFEPSLSEWQIRIVPPTGFRARGLPENRELKFGPAVLTQSFEQVANGVVLGSIRLDTVRGRYTADEGREFLASYLEHEPDLVLEFRFDHEAQLLANARDPAAAMRRHAELTAAEPQKAIHRIRASTYMLELGLGDEARAEALKATQVEPKNSVAFTRLGAILENDLLGRRFGRGFDREGALQAHREALRLDPDDTDTYFHLALVAEVNSEGVRYGPGADLELAIANYRRVVTKRPDWTDGKGLLIQCLWHSGRFDEIAPIAAELPNGAPAASFRLAARVMTANATVALREDAGRGDAQSRRSRVDTATLLLLLLRKYDQARELIAASGIEPSQGTTSLMQFLGNVVPAETLPQPPETAAGAVESVLRLVMREQTNKKALAPWISEKARLNGETQWLTDELARLGKQVSTESNRYFGQSPMFVRDIVLSNLEFREGPFAGEAHRVTVLLHGVAAATMFALPEKNVWRVMTVAPAFQPIGREVLARLDAGDLATAQEWLSAVREEIARETDSETGRFKYFLRAWPHDSSPTDAAAMRLAAHALLIGEPVYATSADELRNVGDALATDAQRAILNTLLVAVARDRGDSALAVSSAESAYPSDPKPADAWWLMASAYGFAERWQDAERVSREWLAAEPNAEMARHFLLAALNGQGRAREGLELLAPAVQLGRANPSQLNLYAWQALVADAVDDLAVKAAEGAYNRQQRRNYASGHTLACVYAVNGRIADARQVLLQILEDQPQIDPQSGEIWLVRGLIAERLGATATALKAYGSIEKPRISDPDSVYAIARARLAQLGNTAG
jgi:transglutaminase-like putative cysteine protease/tetratricopeptide (TPR) repeat protein